MSVDQPEAYCTRWLEKLQVKRRQAGLNLDEHQLVVVLSHFVQLNPAANDFESQLKLLVESASRSHRASLAAAARAVLGEWQAETEPLELAAR